MQRLNPEQRKPPPTVWTDELGNEAYVGRRIGSDRWSTWLRTRRTPEAIQLRSLFITEERTADAAQAALDLWAKARGMVPARQCRECGCTELNACHGGCAWAEEDLCTACVPSYATSCAELFLRTSGEMS